MHDQQLNEREFEHGTQSATVAGLFSNMNSAERAITELKAAGFGNREIGIATGERNSEATAGEVRDETLWDKIKNAFSDREKHQAHEEENAYAYGDDFRGSLSGVGLQESQARYFDQALREGKVLVTVNATGPRSAEAIAIMERNGADLGKGTVEFGKQRTSDLTGVSGERRIQLLGEMLRVHKERVARGEVRVRKEVVSETKNIEVPVTHEELVVERTSVSAEQPIRAELGRDQEIRIPLAEEQVRVEKQPVVTGEVKIGKREVQDTKHVADTVRHEEVNVDKDPKIVEDENRTPQKKVA